LLVNMNKRVSRLWAGAVLQFERGWQWVTPRQQAAFTSAGVVVVLLLLIFSGVTAAVAAVAAWIALLRHFAQTEADRQRRITESYSKAVGQLASEKIEERLGGIYTLERVSRESNIDYWVIMETLTAFVRERAHWNAPSVGASETMARFYGGNEPEIRKEPPTDIAAVLTVIRRRPEAERNREKREGWRFDFREADLRGAHLAYAHLEGANFETAHLENAYISYAHLEGTSFSHAHLEGAVLWGAYLEHANLGEAHLERADCSYARLDGASLSQAHLEGATLWGAHLEHANLAEAHLEGIDLGNAHLEYANLRNAHLESSNLTEAQFVGADLKGANLEGADGDSKTRLPDDVPRPAYWPPYQAPESEA
jgi:uncharacterized protein YjbI with pentapeptide repeats